MKWALRNKTAKERLKMAIFKLLALLVCEPDNFLLPVKRTKSYAFFLLA